jgi:serine protease inhibitor
VRADRPFAWAIVHDPTGTPLFTGHVVNPVAQ